MSYWQRIKSVIGSVLLLLMIPILLFMPQEQGISLVAFVLSLLLIAYGVRVTWYYFRMARHMVGGKMLLCEGILLFKYSFNPCSLKLKSNRKYFK